MCVVYVTNLETCAFTRKTARTEGRQTTLVSNLSQRVRLIHELTQRIGSEERVDHTGDGLGIDQVGRCEHLVVANVHTLTDCTAHTRQTDRELIAQLLTYCANTTVAQVVDIIDGSVGVHQLDKILDDLNDILLGQDTDIHIRVQTQFLIDSVTTYITQVVTLVREEEVLDHLACAGIISRISITQLAVDIVHSLLLTVTRVFLQRVEDDRELTCCISILVYEDGRSTAVEDLLSVLLGNLRFALHDHLITLDGSHLTRVLIHEVLCPALQYTGSQMLTDHLLHILLGHLHFLSEVEDLKNILVSLETDGTEKGCYRQLLLSVDVGIHHIVDIGSKLNP